MENKEYVLNLSYGKDSLACLEAIKQLGYPLDRIVHVEVWATDTIPADLPPMVEFKKYADKIIKERYGYTVEHICAMRNGKKLTYERQFYDSFIKGKNKGERYGFPMIRGAWCNDRLKVGLLNKLANKNTVKYIGIASDEPERIKRHISSDKVLPLFDIGWDEAYCRQWCEDNDLLSPIYTESTRGGCWFCHNQGVNQLRLLRKNYPDLWQLLLKWDKDSPVTFKADGHTVKDFDNRFRLEDEMCLNPESTFRWSMLKEPLQIRLF